jgi:hypothetical protein
MMRKLKSGLSILMLVVLGLALTPMEYVHSLYGHEDDHCLPHSDPGIGKAHHHCKILQLIPYLFLDAGKQVIPGKHSFSRTIFINLYKETVIYAILKPSPRAPPANS